MELNFPKEDATFRDEVRAFITENSPAEMRVPNPEADLTKGHCSFAALHMSLIGALRPFSNVRHSVVVERKPDIETEPKWSD